jgi:broad specificity phosphatase PhoE
MVVSSVFPIRHAEPHVLEDIPALEWPLSEKGRGDARLLGASLAGRTPSSIVWTSPERRASETAALAFPQATTAVREQLSEVGRPWYASEDEHLGAVAKYLSGKVIEGWEHHDEVIFRIARLSPDLESFEGLVLVSHGLLLTTWLDDQIGLDDPLSFWSNLCMPDAWEFNLEEKSLRRIVQSKRSGRSASSSNSVSPQSPPYPPPVR